MKRAEKNYHERQKQKNTEYINPHTELKELKQQFLNITNEITTGSFIIDDRNREIIGALFNYFMEVPGNLDLHKGIWLEGDVGTGKTTLMQAFSTFMRRLQKGFKVFSCTSVATCYSIDGNLDFFLQNRDGYLQEPVPICFDELGREPIPTAHFGTKLNVMQHVLHIRYEYWKMRGLKTFVITNADASEISHLYGDYIRDRRKEMFNIIPLTGNSRRTP